MTSLSNGAARKVPASYRRRSAYQAELGRPDLRWRSIGNPLGRALVGLLLAAVQPLLVWQRRIRDREALQRMPDYILRDIGLDADKVQEEANKPFWQP